MQLESILSTLEKLEYYDHTDAITLPQVVELIGIQGKTINKAVKEMEPKVRLKSLPSQLLGGKFGDNAVSRSATGLAQSTDLANRSSRWIC